MLGLSLKEVMKTDLLAAIALTSAILTKEYLAAAIVTLMLITGRALEKWAEGQAERELKSLISRAPRTVHRKSLDGSLIEIPVSQIEIGDCLLVRSGEIVATDGVLNDPAVLDESALTGEPLPVSREIGAEISSGILNAGAPFFFTATSTSERSTYAAIIDLVAQAQSKSAPGIRIAQQWSIRFLPVALITAGLSWWISGDVHRAVAVLVVATPCPLILAVPIAIVAGLSRAARHGAIIKGGGVLELLGNSKVVLLDKTGTLTHGGPVVSAIYADQNSDKDEVLRIAASVDQFSPHIVAKALIAEAKKKNVKLEFATNIHEEAGHHIAGEVNGDRIRVGQIVGDTPIWVSQSHPLMVGVECNDVLIGVIGLEDPIRLEASAIVEDLRHCGVKHIALVSGDRNQSAQDVAASVGISEVYSQISAEGKLEIVRDFQKRKLGSVVVVGDGVNDAPALAAADVGVAMGARGASAASEAADVVIVEDSIDRLTSAIRIAQMSRRKALQSAFIGMALSIAAMGFAASGSITPSQGALLQELIDVTAILWALTALRARL